MVKNKTKKLNFGCGKIIKPKKEGWINADIQKGKGIDKSFNFEKFPYPFEDNYFDYIFCDNVLEHLNSPIKVINQLWRISKKNALIEIKVPYYKSKWAWGDLTHVNFFSEESIKQLFEEKGYIYDKREKFEIKEVYLKPSKPFNYAPNFIRKVFSRYLDNIYSEIQIKAKVIK